MAGGLDLNVAQARELGRAAVDVMARYYDALPKRPVMPDTTAQAIRELMDEPLPREGTEPARLLRVLEEVVFPLSRHNGHPRMFGYVASPGTVVTAVGDLMTGTLNANVTSWRSAPGATAMEHVAIGWVKEILGYPADAIGLFVSGGSMANLAGLAAARSAKFPEVKRKGVGALSKALRVYVSDEAHFSIEKAAGVLGIGEENVRAIPTDAGFRIDIEALERAIGEDLASGHLPFCVAGSAGTVASGAFDPLERMAEVARRYGLWLHVDGAYGGFAALAPSARGFFRGIEYADSVALDPHKWLYSSMGCGCVLYRDPEPARLAFGHSAEYTRTLGWEHDEAFAFWDYGPELSRRFRALNVWLQIKAAGAKALGEAVERNLECASYLEQMVRASEEFEMLAPVTLSIVCFRHVPRGFTGDLSALNERILVELQRAGHSYMSNARLRGQFALRACILNYRTSRSDMEVLLQDVRLAAARVLAGA